MTWVKLDDQFFLHPKAIAAGKDGRVLFLAGLCYCASQLTDGKIVTPTLKLLAATADVKISTARTLEQVGLWEEIIGGFQVHDYLVYNPSAAQVREARAKKAAAGALGGSKRAAKAQADAQATASAGGSAEVKPPIPIPVPFQSEGQTILRDSVENLDLRMSQRRGA